MHSSSSQRGQFPPTQWSRILGGPAAQDLEQLARAYWRPINAWLRARLRLREEEAMELTQEAFAWMLQTRFFDRADPSRGRFRAFLKTALAHFAVEQHRKHSAHKRGGHVHHEDLDAAVDHVDERTPAPDEVLDREWRRELLARARDELQKELLATDRARHFALFRDWFLLDEEVDHATLAARYEITKTDVSNWLDHAKRRYRALLRSMVRETVDDHEALAEELHWFFGDANAAP